MTQFIASSVIKVLLVFVFLTEIACAQPRIHELADQNDLSIKYQYVYKTGETKKYTLPLDVPTTVRFPTGYSPLGDKLYLVRNTAIVSGTTIATIRVPSSEQFENVRILQLISNELEPTGSEWFDCTILLKRETENRASEYNEAMRGYLPNAKELKVSCELNNSQMKPDEYFAVTYKTGIPPEKPLTKLDVSLTGMENAKDSDVNKYQVSIKNVGEKSAAEVNLRSVFDIDTMLVAFTSSHGSCKRSKWGNGGGSLVCHLGQILPGASVSLELIGRPSGISGKVEPGNLNKNWLIFGFTKERPNDPNFPVNVFNFEPLKAAR